MKSSTMWLAAFCLAANGAVAQTSKDAPKVAAPATVSPTPVPPAANAPVTATPERTTASFGDWTMRCEVPPAPIKRICEVALTITSQGQTAPAAQIALGKPSSRDAMQMTAVLPPNVALLTRPQLAIAQVDAKPFDLIWQRCTPGACYASVVISDQIVGLLSSQSEPGKIIFKNAGDRDVVLPVSFRGLAQALEALASEP